MIFDPAAMQGNAIAGFTSITGRSHTFDFRADGYARGEAIGAISCALDDGSAEAGVQMAGSAIRHDGRSASLTAPNGQAQQAVLRASLADAQMAPQDAALLEAHGTGTALGDPIEAGAVAAAYLSARRSGGTPLAIGSLKANAGHTEPGAGVAGALNLLVKLQSQRTSPNAQLRIINPHVGGSLRGQTACGLCTQVTGLRAAAEAAWLVGGVSSFGYSGTIAHAMLRCAVGVAEIGRAHV